MKRNKL